MARTFTFFSRQAARSQWRRSAFCCLSSSLFTMPTSKKRTYMSRDEASALLSQCDKQLEAASEDLRQAKELAQRAGLWNESSLLDATFPDASRNLAVLRTTAGYSNTDHLVTLTGDARTDRIAELKRNLQKRARKMQPENKGEDRWDKPRIPGERRRRILREKDMPEAPPEPPPSGYVIFVGQMTTKIRHDRPDDHHNQIQGTLYSCHVSLYRILFYIILLLFLNIPYRLFAQLSRKLARFGGLELANRNESTIMTLQNKSEKSIKNSFVNTGLPVAILLANDSRDWVLFGCEFSNMKRIVWNAKLIATKRFSSLRVLPKWTMRIVSEKQKVRGVVRKS